MLTTRVPNGRLESAIKASRTASGVETIYRWTSGSIIFSTVLAFIQLVLTSFDRWIDGSVIYANMTVLERTVTSTLTRWSGHSRGYRWLTAEPDPDTIVIDLRDTYTIAPLLRALEETLSVLIPAVRHSQTYQYRTAVMRRFCARPLRLLGHGLVLIAAVYGVQILLFESLTRTTGVIVLGLVLVGFLVRSNDHSWAELRQTRLFGVLVAIFVPPAPPELDRSAPSKSNPESKGDGDTE